MTVAELVELLNQCKPDEPVLIYTEEGGCRAIRFTCGFAVPVSAMTWMEVGPSHPERQKVVVLIQE